MEEDRGERYIVASPSLGTMIKKLTLLCLTMFKNNLSNKAGKVHQNNHAIVHMSQQLNNVGENHKKYQLKKRAGY